MIRSVPDKRPADAIMCPNCGTGVGLQFWPMLNKTVWAQCKCGFGWDMPPDRRAN